MRRITSAEYEASPGRYILRSGLGTDAPDCPYGNKYQWLGFDLEKNEYVRFSKGLFKKLIHAENED